MVGIGAYMEGRHGSEPRKSKSGEISRDWLQTLRGGLLLPFETDFIHPKELCIVQVLSKPPGLTDEAYCLVFSLLHVLKLEHFRRGHMTDSKQRNALATDDIFHKVMHCSNTSSLVDYRVH